MDSSGNVGVGSDSSDAAAGKLNIKDGTNAEVKDLITVQGYRYAPWQIRVDDTTNAVSKFQVGFSNGTEALSITDGGQVTITDGDLKIGTAGHGIDFSAQTTTTVSGTTPDTTAGAETISHYEQGTWTPSCSSFAGTTTPSEGHYIKIGDLVYATGLVAFSNTADSDNVNIEGLPFTKKSETRFSMGGFITFTTINFWVSAFINASNKIELYKINGTNASYNDVKNNQFRFTVIYPT